MKYYMENITKTKKGNFYLRCHLRNCAITGSSLEFPSNRLNQE